MRSTTLTVSIFAVAAAAAACGGDVDLTGVYRVDRAVASMPCGEDQPVVNPPAFLKFTKGDFLGIPFFSYDECTDAAATDCVSGGGGGYFEPFDDGWSGFVSSSSGFDGKCSLRIDDQKATLRGDVIDIEAHVYSEEDVALPSERCQPEEAEARGDTMPCVSHEQILATRVD
ncbi:MAG TPA: hypothetical protein VNO30_15480 [Kofleriaceae bacterium]|nr:hypothetical protein [Kofleriaceae bacterium]